MNGLGSSCRGAAIALLALAACGVQPVNGTSEYVKSGTFGSQGGSLVVSASDDQSLAGTSITIPPGALSQDVRITICGSNLTVTPAGSQAAGPVVDFGPDGTTFAVPVTMQIPISLAGATTSSIVIRAVEANGSARSLPVEALSGGLATFQAMGFTRFGAVSMSNDGGTPDGGVTCATDSDCGVCGTCINNQCVASARPCAFDGGRGPACMSDADCPPNEACQSGLCVSGPSSDGGSSCGPAPAACGCVCSDAYHCPSSQCFACGASYCFCDGSKWQNVGVDCAADGGTPDAAVCECPNIPAGECDGGVGPAPCYCPMAVSCGMCSTDADCGGCPYACVSGQCKETGGICPASDGGPQACTSDSECGPCNTCVQGACLVSDMGCASDAGTGSSDGGIGMGCECAAPPAGMCTTVGPAPCYCPVPVPCDGGQACSTDSDCGACNVCVNGQCYLNGMACATDGGSPASCNVNGDCAAGQTCVGGMCVPGGASDGGSSGALRWYTTCGYPVCRVPPFDGGSPDAGTCPAAGSPWLPTDRPAGPRLPPTAASRRFAAITIRRRRAVRCKPAGLVRFKTAPR